MDFFSNFPVQLVILDHKMPGLTGDKVLEKIKKINPCVKAIMITAFGTVNNAVQIMKLGAEDFMEKPVDLKKLLSKIVKIENSIMMEKEVETVSEKIEEAELPLNIIGDSHKFKELLSLVRRIAPTEWTALIRGETGTGKELIARLIHLLSSRSNENFIEVNCAAIPENLFESELFGHEKGAFTGAHSRKKGRFELAQNGTIFLDEVGELPLNLQAKMLRVLQEKKINRVGSEKEIKVDVRIITATNRDIKKMTQKKLFREDLYYRLNALEIEIPPLRKRKTDIPALIDFFLHKFTSGSVSFSSDAMTTLIKYSFPGNIRELEHMIQRVVTLSRSSVIQVVDLPSEIRFHQDAHQGDLAERLLIVEKEMIITALEKNQNIQTRAAASLGISERVLRYKIKKTQASKIENSELIRKKVTVHRRSCDKGTGRK
ncbi:MAG: sigma-54 dependent transcriptional regulator [Thermodesulfobacteriota bacterium]|nr:sigma-54 dependent transcriptional regulator [Thermodesulfobacteriota bacterium]